MFKKINKEKALAFAGLVVSAIITTAISQYWNDKEIKNQVAEQLSALTTKEEEINE